MIKKVYRSKFFLASLDRRWKLKKLHWKIKLILYRYEQRLCSERVRFSFAFVVCSVFLNSEQSQMVQDENDCREININKTNQKRRCVVRATITRVLARLDSLVQYSLKLQIIIQ